MTTNRANTIALIICGGYIIVWSIYSFANPLSDAILSHAITAAFGIIIFYILELIRNIKRVNLYFSTKFKYRNKKIRLSFAYLYRIKVDNKYLLVRNSHNGFFQPVGGVYKTFTGAEKIFKKLDVNPDRVIETEKGIRKRDLRIYVQGKNVMDFLDWFNSKEDRETCQWREFCEELLTTKILPQKQFRYIDYIFQKTVQTPLIDLDNGDKGLFYYDVYDLIINDEQKPILEKLLADGDTDNYVWVEDTLINSLGLDARSKEYIYRINPHTKWALNLKWSK